MKIQGVSHSVCGRSSEMKSKSWALKEEVLARRGVPEPGGWVFTEASSPGTPPPLHMLWWSDAFGNALLAEAPPVSTSLSCLTHHHGFIRHWADLVIAWPSLWSHTLLFPPDPVTFPRPLDSFQVHYLLKPKAFIILLPQSAHPRPFFDSLGHLPPQHTPTAPASLPYPQCSLLWPGPRPLCLVPVQHPYWNLSHVLNHSPLESLFSAKCSKSFPDKNFQDHIITY